MKYLRKVLGEVDSQIPVPDSLRGVALRGKLDNVYPIAPAPPDKKSGVQFNLRWLNWHSGLAYAAAFALIVGLFYGLGFHQQPQIVDGNIEIQSQTPAEAPVSPDSADSDMALPESDAQEAPLAPAVGTAPDTDTRQDAAGGTGTPQAPVVQEGLGGGGQTVSLGQYNGYTYAWRANDATDPDKTGFPVTMEILSGEQVVASVDIPDMYDVRQSFFVEEHIVLVGGNGAEIVSRSYNIAAPEAVAEGAMVKQPGTYVNSREYQGFVHVVTYLANADGLADYSIESEALPGATDPGACIITSIDAVRDLVVQKAFTGSQEDISLHNLSAIITYTGTPINDGADAEESPQDASEPEDGEEPAGGSSIYVAQIQLDGSTITLGSVS